MKKLLIAFLLIAGISQAGIIGPPTVPTFTPCCDDITTIYWSPADTIAQVDVLVDGVFYEPAVAVPDVFGTGWLEFAPVAADYTFRIYDEGSTVVGSSYWDSYTPIRVGCTEYVVFGAEQTVVPEPAALGLMVLTAGSALFIRRMFLI